VIVTAAGKCQNLLRAFLYVGADVGSGHTTRAGTVPALSQMRAPF
jgi:hypothetical protein